ncbi:hypothetical protein [Pseudomonas citronellolis]|uniref:hypothetical protein n=1 Tax=Pseudomonas citronellolis TaxID=53408 RepID=UPI0023E4012D|nr:hypothetical protein [Pseudomonas citronellolis]MDF3932123.1 hypothetical protein [Pseudomonas citronellolis]
MTKREQLTYSQTRELNRLAKNPDTYCGSCTNATMNALKRRGLVVLNWVEHPSGLPGLRKELWTLTDAGREFTR